MNLSLIYNFSKNKLKREKTGHDWLHALRVEKNALMIAPFNLTKSEIERIKVACWLHDTIDIKLAASDRVSIDEVQSILKRAQAKKFERDEILHIIQNLSYSKNLVKKQELSLLGKIVQDADRLDAIGAIGIARSFYYGGSKGHSLYNNKEARLKDELTEENYHQQESIINHFYEKLLLLKDTMNTKDAKKIAIERTQFMEEFLHHFKEETNF